MSGVFGYGTLGAFVLGVAQNVYLITDRTAEDLARVERLRSIAYQDMTEAEKAEWNSELKGSYNSSDLNRVEAAVEVLASLLQELPSELKSYAQDRGVTWDVIYEVPYNPEDLELTINSAWGKTDVPTPEEMARYLNNVKAICATLDGDVSRLPNTMGNLTWEGANEIEKALARLDREYTRVKAIKKRQIRNTAAAWNYSGEVYTGEV